MRKIPIFAAVLMMTAMVMVSSCDDDLEVTEERLVYDPYDAKIDGICYLLKTDTKTAEVTAGDVFYAGDVL